MADFTFAEHPCYWCGDMTNSPSWACTDCSVVKERVYAECRGANMTYGEITGRVLDAVIATGRYKPHVPDILLAGGGRG